MKEGFLRHHKKDFSSEPMIAEREKKRGSPNDRGDPKAEEEGKRRTFIPLRRLWERGDGRYDVGEERRDRE